MGDGRGRGVLVHGEHVQPGAWAVRVGEDGECCHLLEPLVWQACLRSSDFREFMNGSQRPGHCSHPQTLMKGEGCVLSQGVLVAVGFPGFSFNSHHWRLQKKALE